MPRARRSIAVSAALMTAAGLLAACSASADEGRPSSSGTSTPIRRAQAKVAANCSTDSYTITTQGAPQDANEQRIQLARRLAANDSGIDIMSIDPPFTAEFANAGFSRAAPQDLQDS